MNFVLQQVVEPFVMYQELKLIAWYSIRLERLWLKHIHVTLLFLRENESPYKSLHINRVVYELLGRLEVRLHSILLQRTPNAILNACIVRQFSRHPFDVHLRAKWTFQCDLIGLSIFNRSLPHLLHKVILEAVIAS